MKEESQKEKKDRKQQGKEKTNTGSLMKSWPQTSQIRNLPSQIQETQWILGRINTELSTCSHIIIKPWKTKEKEKIWDATREKQLGTWRRFDAINDWFPIWRNGVWKAIEAHSQSPDRKNTTRNCRSSKISLAKWKWNKIPSQLKKRKVKICENSLVVEYHRKSFRLKGSDPRR